MKKLRSAGFRYVLLAFATVVLPAQANNPRQGQLALRIGF
jgi:hypothetical protein